MTRNMLLMLLIATFGADMATASMRRVKPEVDYIDASGTARVLTYSQILALETEDLKDVLKEAAAGKKQLKALSADLAADYAIYAEASALKIIDKLATLMQPIDMSGISPGDDIKAIAERTGGKIRHNAKIGGKIKTFHSFVRALRMDVWEDVGSPIDAKSLSQNLIGGRMIPGEPIAAQATSNEVAGRQEASQPRYLAPVRLCSSFPEGRPISVCLP